MKVEGKGDGEVAGAGAEAGVPTHGAKDLESLLIGIPLVERLLTEVSARGCELRLL